MYLNANDSIRSTKWVRWLTASFSDNCYGWWHFSFLPLEFSVFVCINTHMFKYWGVFMVPPKTTANRPKCYPPSLSLSPPCGLSCRLVREWLLAVAFYQKCDPNTIRGEYMRPLRNSTGLFLSSVYKKCIGWRRSPSKPLSQTALHTINK